MSVAGVGSTGLQYDFTSMTSKQAYDAAKDLQSKGIFSAAEAGRLEGAASGVDYAAVDRSTAGSSTAHTLADPTKRNWIADMQQTSDWYHANAGSVVGNDNSDTLLSALKTYQSSAVESYAKAATVTE